MKKSSKLQIIQKVNKKINEIKQDITLSQEINQLTNEWKDIMYEAGLYTNNYNTYTLLNIAKKSYGFHCNIYATKGLNLEDLDKAKSYIETGLGCIFLFYIKKGQKIAEAKFITEGFGGEDIRFIPPETTPFELYLGNSVDSTPVIISAKEVSHFLLSGSNGSGKSRMLDCMITTLINNCDETEVELYLAQIAKNDLVVYEDAKCCRAFCETLDQVEIMLDRILTKMNDRSKLIKPMRKDFKGSDVSDYNKLHSDRKLSACWIIFDEIASIMDKTGDDKDTTKQKTKITKMIEEIARIGRALGIFLGVCLQRPTANMLSSLVKSQTNLKISFSQNNIKSSEVATDDPNIAIGLDDRVAVYSCRARGFDFVKTPYIDDKIIEKYVKPKSQRGHRNLFTDLEKLKSDKTPQIQDKMQDIETEDTIQQPTDKGTAPLPLKIKEIFKDEIIPKNETKQEENEEKIKKISLKEVKIPQTNIVLNPQIPNGDIVFDNVDPFKIQINEEKISENIKNIPNFVPYEPGKCKVVIDETKLNLFNSQKIIIKDSDGKEES